MRAALLTALCSTGCLISSPEGAAQTWPPVLGVTVEAVTSGDLDANGSADIVVYSSGTSSQAGMYLITAGKDLVNNQVASFSKFVPVDIDHPTAAFQTTGVAPAVYVATQTDKVELTQYSNILTEKASVKTTVPASTGSLWVRPVTFPGNMVHIAVSNGSAIDHVASDFGDAKPIPAPSGPSWDMAQLATSYSSGLDQIVVVATPTTIQRAALPTTMGAMFMYSTVRSGAPWSGQTTFDLDGDGREEIIGFDLSSHQLCVVDPGTASLPVTPTCLAVSTNFPGSEVQIFVGTLTPNTTAGLHDRASVGERDELHARRRHHVCAWIAHCGERSSGQQDGSCARAHGHDGPAGVADRLWYRRYCRLRTRALLDVRRERVHGVRQTRKRELPSAR